VIPGTALVLSSSLLRSTGKMPFEPRERGASLVEYALLVALVAFLVIAAVRSLGSSVSSQFKGIGAVLNPQSEQY
jgi:Flp pilus assembly pilin Flp